MLPLLGRTLPDRREKFVGPRPAMPCFESLRHDDHPNDLLGCFAAAQRGHHPPAWVDEKVQRKIVWARDLGIEEFLIVPTLYSCDMLWDGDCEETPEFVDDGEGGFTPSFDTAPPIQRPSDPSCRAALCALLRAHGQIVIKPAVGANSKGVLILSTTAEGLKLKDESDLTGGAAAAAADGRHEDEGETAALMATIDEEADDADDEATDRVKDGDEDDGSDDGSEDEPRVWVGKPVKTWRQKKGDGEGSISFAKLWREQIVRNALLRGTFLAEPTIPHDHELCVLAINGGRLLILAGRSLVMERLVRIKGEAAARVAESDFEVPEWFGGSSNSIRSWKLADKETRRMHTQWALTHIVEGDPSRRTISDVLLDTAERLASSYFEGKPSAAIRIDFFVRWGTSGQGDGGGGDGGSGARVWVNEVEHGFNPASLVGWYGARLTTLAIQFWLIGNSESARYTYEQEVLSAIEQQQQQQQEEDNDTTRPATDRDFHDLLGQRVTLDGLSARKDLNGRTARVMSWHATTGRAGVKLDAGAGEDGADAGGSRLLSIRPENLIPIVDEPGAPMAVPW